MDIPKQPTHWSAERSHADLQRAVGGTLNLVREVSRISQHLEPEQSAERMLKRIQFFSYELESDLRFSNPSGEQGKMEALNHFFFNKKGFACTGIAASLQNPSEAFLLHHVLNTRTGAPTILALIYAFLAERIGFAVDFVDLKPTCFVRWNESGRSRFIDITRAGATISSDELIETLHTRFKMTTFCNASLLETYSFETYLAEYLRDLRGSMKVTVDPEHLLFLQNNLISYQPSNLHLIGERALLHRRLGNFKSALADLKRYFAFHDRERAPLELRVLYAELVELLEKSKTTVKQE